MNKEQKFNCIFCKDIFDNKEELQVHFRKHADPQFKSKNRYGGETQVSDEKSKEKSEMVSCDVCSQMFPTISKAITHKHKVHPDHDVKYFCPWCGKLFTMKHPYNNHIQTSHENQAQTEDKIFHCDSCDVDFFQPSAMMYHNRFFHRQDTHIPDVGMSKKLRLYNQDSSMEQDNVLLEQISTATESNACIVMGDFNYRGVRWPLEDCGYLTPKEEKFVQWYKDGNLLQLVDEVLTLYYCAFCGEEYENKVNLFKHITDDHSDENQSPEEVLRCPLCEAIFYHLDAYEIHLSFHTTEDLYSNQNDLFGDLVDFSLETLPPIIEKVENREDLEAHCRDTDAELNVGIETFLELNMDHTEDSNSGKVKKKKRKKSKKSAITLDEFLSMNQDVFGEDLDFQGVEELPTQIVKKRIKTNKNPTNSVTSAELEKLKQKGIVVVKVGGAKSTKTTQKRVAKKNTSNRELKTSSEVLTKLMNQSNNQIKIVKKSVPSVTNNNAVTTTENNMKERNENEIKINEKVENEKERKIDESENTYSKPNNLPPNNNNQNIDSSKTEECSSSLISTCKVSSLVSNKNTEMFDTEHDANSKISMESNRTSNQNTAKEVKHSSTDNLAQSLKATHDSSSKLKAQTNDIESLNTTSNEHTDQPESDYEESDSETVDKSNLKSVEDNEGSNEYINDKIQGSSDMSEPNIRPLVSSLSTLKHLSHLTVKPINTSPECTAEKVCDTKYNDKPQVKVDKEQKRLTASTNNATATKSQTIIDKDPTLDALKILSKNITIKSLPIATEKNVSESDDEEEADEIITKTTNNIKLKDISGNQNLTIKKVKMEPNEPSPTKKVINMITNTSTSIQSLKSINKGNSPLLETPSRKNNSDDTLNSPSQANNTNILKHLPNITTKPVLTKKIVQPQVVKQTNTSVKIAESVPKEQEIIEISDIDDSDNETDYCNQQREPKQNTAISIDPLRNLSKHITVKSLNQPTQAELKNIKVEKADEQTNEDFGSDAFDSDTDTPSVAKLCSQKLSSKNFALKNALKNLGKNITVKSRTSSPCHSNKSQDHSQSSNINEADDDDSDSHVGKVKITELEDTNMNNDNFEDNSDTENDNNQPIVESPHDSFSDNDEVDDDDKLLDFESEINTSTVVKSNQEITANKNTLCLNNLKNISKNLTIKSLNSNTNTDKQEKSKSTPIPENTILAKNRTTQIATKPTKPLVTEPCNDDPSSRNFKKAANFVDQTSNESLNQKVSVNKEVTVKTFQTKTVIQQITTTVTKTIKTVNQTVKQEMRNSNQMSIPVMPQRVQGMRPSTSKNLQGVVIRQAAPAAVRSNNTITQIRPAATAVRASKQVIPLRPGLSITRPSTPRMPSAKTNLPRSSPNKQVMGKPLKFSPSAIASASAKRPNIEEISGPFSCFKKPKESLIPVSDIPVFAASSGDNVVQMKAASQTNTNYMSTSKVVKGNTVLTATQMKSEISSSMQQFSRLGNTVGIKVKSAQVKQSQVQESETNSKQRTTLEAIEKLQKQGLLVKKPRIEVNDAPDDNVGIGYSSADEQDE